MPWCVNRASALMKESAFFPFHANIATWPRLHLRERETKAGGEREREGETTARR